MSNETYQGTRSRLEEILEEVNRDDISLDDALELYEEAVKLSLAACDLSESDLNLSAELASEQDEVGSAEASEPSEPADSAASLEDDPDELLRAQQPAADLAYNAADAADMSR